MQFCAWCEIHISLSTVQLQKSWLKKCIKDNVADFYFNVIKKLYPIPLKLLTSN